MEHHIVIETKDQYGRLVVHPFCDTAKLFARIAGTKTLTVEALLAITHLGYDVVERTHGTKYLGRRKLCECGRANTPLAPASISGQ